MTNEDMGFMGRETRPKKKIRRSIFIGLGGTGNEIIRQLKRESLTHGFETPLFQYCVLDTVAYDEKPGMNQLMHLRNGEEYLNIGNFNPNEVLKNRENWPVIANWWGSRSTSNLVTVDEGAGQMRAVGRMGLFVNFNSIEAQLRRIVRAIMDVGNREIAIDHGFDVSNAGPIVYIVFSLCGGTGSSLFLDIAYLLRDMLKSSENTPEIVAVALLPGPYLQTISSQPQRERIQANAHASLMELERLHNIALGLDDRPNGKDIWRVQYSNTSVVASAEPPFSYIYLIDDTNANGERYTIKRIYTRVSRAIFWLSGPSTGTVFWERAKNLMSKTVASGARADASGMRRLSIYSSLGISTIAFDWRLDRMGHTLENRFIRGIQEMEPTKLDIPIYLNTSGAFLEEVCGEQSGINVIPATNMLRPTGTFKDKAAIDERIDEFNSKYQSALATVLTTNRWRLRKDDYRAKIIKHLMNSITLSLRQRGPAATLTEVSVLLDRLNTLSIEVVEKQQEQQALKAELEAEYLKTAYASDTQNGLQQIIHILRTVPGRIYFFEAFRRGSNSHTRDLQNLAMEKATRRYRWYDASFKALLYDDAITSILNPLGLLLSEQKAVLTEANDELKVWRERNEQEKQIQASIRELDWFERIRPASSEEEQIEQAIATDKIKLDESLHRVLFQAFRNWPHPAMGIMDVLETGIKQLVTDTLKYIAGEQHLARRLLSIDCTDERQLFLQGAECLWNFTREANQEVIPYLESVHMIGYGVDSQQRMTTIEIERSLTLMLQNLPSRPETVPTHVSDELAYIKTQHGLMISSLRSIPEMEHAYQIMKTVRRAPYLHIDYNEYVRMGYRPLMSVEIAPQEIINDWLQMSDILDSRNMGLADEIRTLVEDYSRRSAAGVEESLDVQDANHPIFELVDGLHALIDVLKPTSAMMQAMMKVAELEEILLAQGWIKIEPGYGERFDDTLHESVGIDYSPDMRPNRIISLERAGYLRKRDGRLHPIVRKAQVKICG